MLPFPIRLVPGRPLYDQLVYAVKRAVARGVLAPGDRFPSVRALSQELRINPNTVQKAVAELTSLGILEVHSGQGCFVAARSHPPRSNASEAIGPLLEALVVEAHGLGLTEEDVKRALARQWQQLRREKS
jgi:GntR family transcriptional regulator